MLLEDDGSDNRSLHVDLFHEMHRQIVPGDPSLYEHIEHQHEMICTKVLGLGIPELTTISPYASYSQKPVSRL